MHIYVDVNVRTNSDLIYLAADQKHGQQLQETSITKEEGRDLTEVDLKTYLQESSHSTKTTASMSRVASFSILASLDHKMKKCVFVDVCGGGGGCRYVCGVCRHV